MPPSAEEIEDNKFEYSVDGGNVYIRKEPKRVKKEESREEKRAKEAKAKKAECRRNLEELFKMAWMCRCNFILSAKDAEKIYSRIDEFVLKCVLNRNHVNLNALEIEIGTADMDEEYDMYSRNYTAMEVQLNRIAPSKIRTVSAVYGMTGDSITNNCFNYEGRYVSYDGERLKRLYGMLEEFGYKISADERALIDGTHSAYYREDG